MSLPPSVELAASGLAAPRVALTLWLDFLTDAAGWLSDFLTDAAAWLSDFLTDAAAWLSDFLTDAAGWLSDFLTDAAGSSLNLTIDPPGEVLRRLDVELAAGREVEAGPGDVSLRGSGEDSGAAAYVIALRREA